MHMTAHDVLGWIADQVDGGNPVAFARIVGVSGFGGKRSGEYLGITATDSYGHLAMGAADAATLQAARSMLSTGGSSLLVEVPVGDTEAVAAGLACGGSASVQLLASNVIAPQFWERARAGLPVVLCAAAGAAGAEVLVVEGDAHFGHGPDDVLSAARKMLAKGPIEQRVSVNDTDYFCELVAPQPRLFVLGEAELSKALVRQGELLGWQVLVASDRGTSATQAVADAASCGPLDGVVVLSHNIPVSCSVLAAALRSSCGYVGALGSRHTQGARAAHLATLGLEPGDIARVRGPVGLDLGSRTPEETALAIAAEMLAVRSARNASPLSVQ